MNCNKDKPPTIFYTSILQQNAMDIYLASTDLMSLIAAMKISLNVIASGRENATVATSTKSAAASTEHQ